MPTATTPSTTTRARGFGFLPCPKCGNDAAVTVNLFNVNLDDACTCRECEESFSLAEVRDWMARWQRVLAWIDTAPVLEE